MRALVMSVREREKERESACVCHLTFKSVSFSDIKMTFTKRFRQRRRRRRRCRRRRCRRFPIIDRRQKKILTLKIDPFSTIIASITFSNSVSLFPG